MTQSTLYIIAYDIPSDKRRTKIHKTLCGFGEWSQYSLFECFLTAKELVKLQAKLESILDPEEDSVRMYPLCNNCQKGIKTVGGAVPKEKVTYIL